MLDGEQSSSALGPTCTGLFSAVWSRTSGSPLASLTSGKPLGASVPDHTSLRVGPPRTASPSPQHVSLLSLGFRWGGPMAIGLPCWTVS